jgi:hypothetical protein
VLIRDSRGEEPAKAKQIAGLRSKQSSQSHAHGDGVSFKREVCSRSSGVTSFCVTWMQENTNRYLRGRASSGAGQIARLNGGSSRYV